MNKKTPRQALFVVLLLSLIFVNTFVLTACGLLDGSNVSGNDESQYYGSYYNWKDYDHYTYTITFKSDMSYVVVVTGDLSGEITERGTFKQEKGTANYDYYFCIYPTSYRVAINQSYGYWMSGGFIFSDGTKFGMYKANDKLCAQNISTKIVFEKNSD